ncbi:MAG TPA: UvrD-helicase domain-containing protein, partial [Planctomycetota bacterium]|nr:UvrD-helicase domain-containing protein [Planctomycetota bacterium]
MARKNATRDDLATPLRFTRHGVLEASAGTGKTYTVVEMVKDLIRREGATIQELLVLTFTEKAAAELQDRIRSGLKAAVDAAEDSGDAAQRRAFAQALHDFPRATIGTLHGFCNRVLREFGFESDLPFRHQLVDDRQLMADRLRDLQREQWPAWYGAELPEVLAASGYPKTQGMESAWEAKVLRLVGLFQPQAGDRLSPERQAPVGPRIFLARFRDDLQRVAKLGPSADRPALQGWAQSLAVDAKIHGNAKPKFTATLYACLSAASTALRWFDTPPGDSGTALLLEWTEALNGESLAYLREKLSDKSDPAAAARITSLCDGLQPCVDALAGWREQLTVNTVYAVQETARAWKRERGLISFADMLTLLHEKLVADQDASGRTGALVTALRKRYRFALVDEFQDTDPIQWAILQVLFVAEPESHGGRLFIIGDPKQSIYRFRGADVETYLRARKLLLAGEPAGELGVNWRSTPQLIGVLNRLFGGNPQASATPWFVPEHGITFTPVQEPGNGRRRYALTGDQTGRGALTICQLDTNTPKPERQWRYARWLAREIRRITCSPAAGLRFRNNATGEERSVTAGDIAILVKARRYAGLLQRALAEVGVPSTTYKQSGLFGSEEAVQLLYVLQAIEQPGDRQRVCKALLTRVFGYRPDDLVNFGGFAPGHRVPALLTRWADWAEARRWSRLFASILEETGVLDRDLAAPDGDRRVTNLKQLTEYLCAQAYGRKLSLSGVIRALQNAGILAEEIDDPADRQRLETEASKVRIMTIHVSKGLQFPVVFLFDPPGKPVQRDPWLKFHHNGRLTYDLLKDPAHKEADALEAAQEQLRLCYVAMTRTMFKLYLPGPGLGPEADVAKVATQQMAPGIAAPDARLLVVFPPDAPDSDVTWVWADDPLATGKAAETPVDLKAAVTRLLPAPRPDPQLNTRRVVIESFTHLRTRTAGVSTGLAGR